MAVNRPSDADRVSFPRGAWAAITVFGLLMLAVLAVQVVLIRDQRAIAKDQRALAERQLRIVGPLADDTRPLARDVRRDLPHTRAIADRADRLARAATPVVQELDGAQLQRAIVATGRLADTLLRDGGPDALAREALALQRRQLAVAEDTLTVARDAARHAANLDRKLGGGLPAGGAR